jgi:pimeloyl-ACP methyl ester carboxylesterase
MPPVEFATTNTLEIGFHRYGATNERVAMLLHGWPDSAHTWHPIATRLAHEGFHVVVPYLRGYGPTRFLHATTMRSGQLSALAQDVIDFADALKLDRFDVVGHDWGARAAYIGACLWPKRIRSCCALSVGWGTNSPDQRLPLAQVQNYWYHWYMATPRGEALVRNERRAFTKYIWDLWCPFWKVSQEDLEETLACFDNPDWADVVLHSYRHRWGHAPADPTYDALEAKLAIPPLIEVPTLVLHGADDPVNPPATSASKEALFGGKYERYLIERCGHFPQREHPAQVAEHIVRFLKQHP